MVSDSKRNPDHIISSSIFLQRGQFIEFHIRFTYDIFLPKKKLSNSENFIHVSEKI